MLGAERFVDGLAVDSDNAIPIGSTRQDLCSAALTYPGFSSPSLNYLDLYRELAGRLDDLVYYSVHGNPLHADFTI
jgi:hypothetical protein